LSISSYSDVDINSHDGSPFSFPSALPNSPPVTAMPANEHFHYDFSGLINQGQGPAETSLFDFDPRPRPPSPVQQFSVLSTPNRGDFVIYYFNYVRKFQYVFAGNSVTNATYSVRQQL